MGTDSGTKSSSSADEDMHVVAAAALSLTYSVLDSSHFCFCSRVYHVRDVHSSVPEWQKVVSGAKLNDEAFVSTVRIDRPTFYALHTGSDK